MWMIVGHRSKLLWNPNGAQIQRRCPACGQDSTFYEKQITKSFWLNFTDVLDYERQRVMACGRCDAYYATDELGPPTSPIVDDVTEAASEARRHAGNAVPYLERAGNAVVSGLSSLMGRPTRRSPSPRDPSTSSHDLDDGGEIDIGPDYAGPARRGPAQVERSGAGRVDDDMEARFRELEEQAAKEKAAKEKAAKGE